MAARSAVTRLPDTVRKLLETWLKAFLAGEKTLDQVMQLLDAQLAMAGVPAEDAPSRSSVHRHAQKFQAIVERVQRAKELTGLLAEQLGPAVADGQGVQVMVTAVQSLTYDLLASLEEGKPVDPKSIHDLAKAAHHLASAQKTDADRALKVEAEALRKAAKAAATVGKEMGWSADTARKVRESILGVGKKGGGG